MKTPTKKQAAGASGTAIAGLLAFYAAINMQSPTHFAQVTYTDHFGTAGQVETNSAYSEDACYTRIDEMTANIKTDRGVVTAVECIAIEEGAE